MPRDSHTAVVERAGPSVDSLRADLHDLRSAAGDETDPRSQAALRLIGEGLRILDELVSSLPDEAEPRVVAGPSRPAPPRPVDLSPVVDRAHRSVSKELRARGIRFRRGGLPVVLGRETELEEALRGFLDLSARRMGNAPEREIEIQARTNRDEAIIALRDTGSGEGGRLPVVRAVVEAHGGSIRIESSPSEGTTTYLTLPLA